jgi:hypothetical protein
MCFMYGRGKMVVYFILVLVVTKIHASRERVNLDTDKVNRAWSAAMTQ